MSNPKSVIIFIFVFGALSTLFIVAVLRVKDQRAVDNAGFYTSDNVYSEIHKVCLDGHSYYALRGLMLAIQLTDDGKPVKCIIRPDRKVITNAENQ